MYDIQVRIEAERAKRYKWEIVKVHNADDWEVLRSGTARSFMAAAKNSEVPFQSETQLAKQKAALEPERAPRYADNRINPDPQVVAALDEGATRRRTG